MKEKDLVVKHLEIIQGIINRLGHDSFLIKSWSMTLLVGGIILLARSEVASGCIVLAFLIPVIGFWILDVTTQLFSMAGAIVPRNLQRGQKTGNHRL